MWHKDVNTQSKFSNIALKMLVLFGGAWFVFTSFGDTAMSVLLRTETMSVLNVDFLLSILLDFTFKFTVGLSLILFSLIGKTRKLKPLFVITGCAAVAYSLYLLYFYIRYNLAFFTHIDLSFNGLRTSSEYFLKLFFVISIMALFICCGLGKIQNPKNFETVICLLLFAAGLLHYLSVLTGSVGALIHSDALPMLRSLADLISYGVIMYVVYDYSGLINFKPKSSKVDTVKKQEIQPVKRKMDIQPSVFSVEELEFVSEPQDEQMSLFSTDYYAGLNQDLSDEQDLFTKQNDLQDEEEMTFEFDKNVQTSTTDERHFTEDYSKLETDLETALKELEDFVKNDLN